MEGVLRFCWERVTHDWPLMAGGADLLLDIWATTHVILHKRDSRSAVAWVVFIWFVPVVGPFLYFLLGINRIQRRSQAIRRQRSTSKAKTQTDDREKITVALPTLARLVGQVSGRPLLGGNRVHPLVNGDQAYPAMLRAINEATVCVFLSTYIFGNDRVGKLFLDALARAVCRRVDCRVLIDDVGARYSFPSLLRPLRQAGVRIARFLPTIAPWSFPYANLRDHRKILIVDGRVAFTGGMNIREGHSLGLRPRHPVQDLHFQIEGPVIIQLAETFADDWKFSAGEDLRVDCRCFTENETGSVLARAVSSGPDDDFEKVRMIYLGALACAQSTVTIVTPYFLPDPGLIAAINAAALRGIEVNVLLPERCNLRLVQWASRASLWQVLGYGCRVWFTPPPFDHTKVLLVDRAWSLIGSSNWDPRSLRLNFEFDLECYCCELASSLEEIVRKKMAGTEPVTLEDLDKRPTIVKLRDGIARLFAPYL
jgi:cardiolipin synthase